MIQIFKWIKSRVLLMCELRIRRSKKKRMNYESNAAFSLDRARATWTDWFIILYSSLVLSVTRIALTCTHIHNTERKREKEIKKDDDDDDDVMVVYVRKCPLYSVFWNVSIKCYILCTYAVFQIISLSNHPCVLSHHLNFTIFFFILIIRFLILF